MRLWQTTWNNTTHRLLLWGETQIDSDNSLVNPPHNLHPQCCSEELLRQDLEAFEIDAEESRLEIFQLPTSADAPLLSPNLRFDSSIPEDTEFRSWQIPCLILKPEDALNLLTYIPPSMPEGLVLDESFLYWREVSKLTLELLTRGRFLPGITRAHTEWKAIWQLVPTESQDYPRLITLAKGMPAICRAIDQNRLEEPGVLLESFLANGADALIRLFLRRQPLTNGLDQIKLVGKYGVQLSWLNALVDSEPLIRGTEHQISQFETKLHHWSGQALAKGSATPVRTTFQLLSPEDENDPWTLELLLQSREDEELIVSAEEFWQGELGFLAKTGIPTAQIEEQLLRDLGCALRVFPLLDRALNSQTPSMLQLSLDEAYHFLRETARMLEDLEIGVILPDWWRKNASSLGLQVSIDPPNWDGSSSWGMLGAEQLLKASWKIVVGDTSINQAEFDELLKSGKPLKKIGDAWIELPPDKIASTNEFLNKRKDVGLTLLEALRLGFGATDDEQVLPIVGLSTSGWLEQLLDNSRQSIPQLVEPEGFIGTLRPYQRVGLSWLSFLSAIGVGACLADDMGLGKTIQLLATILHEQMRARQLQREKPHPTLLVVPMSTLDNWEQEAKRFAPSLTTYLHHGPQRARGDEFISKAQTHDIILTTYSLAFRDEEHMKAITWGRIALDEAQNIKNSEAKQTKAIRRIAHSAMEKTASTTPCHRVALTGTPLENHLDELWSILDFLNPGILGNLREFRSQFTVPIERYRNEQASETLSRLLQPFVLRRMKNDPKIISDLPEKIEMDVYTKLSEEQVILYRTVLDEMLPQVDTAQGIHRKGLVLATITRLKQICNHPSLYLKDGSELHGRSGKLSRLEELLEVILAEGDRALLFTQYAQMGHLLQPYLQERFGQPILFLHGGLSKSARDKQITSFQSEDGPSVFILSLKAGGYGLNLTRANQVIHYDQWWNPAVQQQATDRAYRIGQKQAVQVRTFITTNTLEERINEMVGRKRELAEQVVGSTRNQITQLSTDELRTLLQFSGKQGYQEEDDE